MKNWDCHEHLEQIDDVLSDVRDILRLNMRAHRAGDGIVIYPDDAEGKTYVSKSQVKKLHKALGKAIQYMASMERLPR
jgi:hypothetical protein